MGQDSSGNSVVVDRILLHYGVKGMRWGVRRSRAPQSVEVTQKGRKKLKARGGKNLPASSDAVRTKSLGQVAKKSGYQALTNDDLRKYTERLNLEANAARLDYQRKSAGGKWIAKFMGRAGNQTANQFSDEVSSRVVKRAFTKTALAAL